MPLPERATDDEVGVLARAFNGMLAHLAARDRELQRHRDELEPMMAPRTTGLREAMTCTPQLFEGLGIGAVSPQDSSLEKRRRRTACGLYDLRLTHKP